MLYNKRKEYLQNCQCPHCENSIHIMSHLLEGNYIMVKHADDRKANSMLSNGYNNVTSVFKSVKLL